MSRYTDPSSDSEHKFHAHQAPWPGPDSQAHAVSGWTTPQAKKRKAWPFIVGGLVLLGCGLSIPVLASMGDKPEGVGGQIYVDSPSPQVQGRKATPTPKRTNSPKSVKPGTWVVGSEIKPGTYRTPGAAESIMTLCTWSVDAKEGGDFLDGGTVGEVDSPGRVVLKKGNVFETHGCQPWILQGG